MLTRIKEGVYHFLINFASIFKPRLKTGPEDVSPRGHIEKSGIRRALFWSFINTLMIAAYTALDAITISSGKVNWHDVFIAIKVAITSNVSMFLKEISTKYQIKAKSVIESEESSNT